MPSFFKRQYFQSLAVSFCAFFVTQQVLAQDTNLNVMISGEQGALVVAAKGKSFKFKGVSIETAGTFDDRVLLTEQTGGSFCPSFHYWLDLSGTEPVLTDSFGDCAEVLDIELAENGSLVATAGGPGDRIFVYAGGATVETRDFVPVVDDTAPVWTFEGKSLHDFFADAGWRKKLVDLVGQDAVGAATLYFTGPGGEFKPEGDHWVARGCARGLCGDVRIAVVVEPDTQAVMMALESTLNTPPFFVAGTPTRLLPKSFASFLAKTSSRAALKAGFDSLSRSERLGLQKALAARGAYNSSIDGKFGEKTSAGLVKIAIETAHEHGQLPVLQSAEGVAEAARRILKISDDPAFKPRGTYGFEGQWDCGMGTRIVMTESTYQLGKGPVLRIVEVVDLSDTARGVTFEDGYRLGFFDITGLSMTWASPETGDSFECYRMAASQPLPQTSASNASDDTETAKLAQNTAVLPDLENGLNSDTLDQTRKWLFEGVWACTSDSWGTNQVMSFTFGPEAVTVSEMGSTVTYADVLSIGGRDTAFHIKLKDFEEAAIAELGPTKMILFSHSSVFDCDRVS